MSYVKKIVDFYVFSNIHVAIAGFCFTKISLLRFGLTNNLSALFVGLSILIAYNLIRYYEMKKNQLKWFEKWFNKHVIYLIVLLILASVFIVYILFFCNFRLLALVILFPFAFMTFFYVIPLFKIGNIEVSFRNFPGVKIFSIAIAWAGITVFFPLFEENITLSNAILLEFFQRIVFLVALILPFDIRDVYVDPVQLRTIPQLFGIRKSKIIGTLLLSLFVCIEFINKSVLNKQIESTILIAILTLLFLWYSNPKKTRFYSSFWVELIPIVWLGLVLLI